MFFNDFPTLGRIGRTNSSGWTDANKLRVMINDRIAQFEECVGPNDRVIIGHGGSAEFIADLLAVWSVGATAACINPALTQNEIDTVKEFIEPIVGLFDPNEKPVFYTPKQKNISPPKLDDPALLLFTSGTTGNPKGVEHSFRSLSARICLNQSYIPNEILQKTLCPLPTHFGHGLIGNILTPLLAGGDVLLLDDKSPMGLAKVGDVIDEHQIKFLSSVPSFWKILLKFSKPPSKGSLARVHIGSAPLSRGLWETVAKWSRTDQVFNMYGITETANWIGGTSLHQGRNLDGRIGSVWGGAAMILNSEGQLSRHGNGEILIQSPSLMNGYYKQPDLTADVLKNGWFHTGDIGVIEEDGEIRITGRSKSEINRAGMKILPEEIDLLLERHEKINEACVFGLSDPISGEKVAAACVLQEGVQITPKELAEWMKNLIRYEAIPETWFFLEEIPKTDRGKINRDIVRTKCLELGETV
ncbi:MAG: acyl--CoA ligase [Sneathiella sp.]|nr:acyl--CoA ligase [Sneathiella sp.]